MDKITQSDLVDIAQYERTREDFRREVMEHKAHRRVQLGPEISITFEDRKTLIFQIQEMMRTERMVREEVIQEEIDIYNTLIPEPSELSATLFIEITESDQIREKLHKFLGLTDGNSLWLQLDDHTVYAQFEEGRSQEDRISSVHYIRFQIPLDIRERFHDPSSDIKFCIAHGDYQYEVPVSEDMRESLSADLVLN